MFNNKDTKEIQKEFIEVVYDNQCKIKPIILDILEEMLVDSDNVISKINEILLYLHNILKLSEGLDAQEERKKIIAEREAEKKKKKPGEEEEPQEEEDSDEDEDSDSEEGEGDSEEEKKSKLKEMYVKYKGIIFDFITRVKTTVSNFWNAKKNTLNSFLEAISDKSSGKLIDKIIHLRIRNNANIVSTEDINKKITEFEGYKKYYVELNHNVARCISKYNDNDFIVFFDIKKASHFKFIEFYQTAQDFEKRINKSYLHVFGEGGLEREIENNQKKFDEFASLLKEFYLLILDNHFLRLIENYKKEFLVLKENMKKLDNTFESEKRFNNKTGKEAVRTIDRITSR